MPWWVASLMSNVAIIATEYLNRVSPSLSVALPRTIPFIIVAQLCLYQAWNGAPHWMMAWVVFVIGNASARILSVYAFAEHEIASWPLLLGGVAVMLGGSLIIKQGLS